MDRSRLLLLLSLCLACGLAGPGCHQIDYSPRYKPGDIDIYDDLFTVSVVDDQTAVAAGYAGAIYYTNDGGDSWKKGDSGTNRLIYSISMANAREGWAVGQVGTILRTEDGGKTWTFQPNLKYDEGSHLFGVDALDGQTAWAVGEWGSRILTTDGGKTWVDHSLLIGLHHPMFVWLDLRDQERVRKGEKVYEDVGLNSIYCLPSDTNMCWLIGEFGYIFWSDDRGATWTRGEILGNVRMDPIVLPFNSIEIPAADRARLKEFANQIADQTHLNVLIDPFVSKREMAAFGNPEDPDKIFDILSARIDDTKSVLEEAGILTDRLRMPNKPPWDYEDFAEDDPTFLQRYLDGRIADEPMIRISVIQNPFLFDVYFADPMNGLISGLGGVMLRSTDGGRSWVYEETDRKQAFFAVAEGANESIAVGEKGLVRYSSDGGITWKAPPDERFPTVFTFMRDLGFDRSRKVGFIVGQEGMVLRSQDGGRSWARVLPPKERLAGAP